MKKTIKIVNETGIGQDTKVYDANTGKELRGVRSITINKIEVDEVVTANIEFIVSEMDIVSKEFIAQKKTTDVTTMGKDSNYRCYKQT